MFASDFRLITTNYTKQMKNSNKSNGLDMIKANLTTKSELAAIKGGTTSKSQLISELMTQNATYQSEEESCVAEGGNGTSGSGNC